MKGIRLMHDVLDTQLLDRTQRKMGRADGLLIELRDDEPPRVAAILVGGSVLAERIGRWMVAFSRGIRRLLHIEPAVTRLAFEQVRVIGPCIELDVDAGSTKALRTELWLDDHVICRIPGGAGSERK
jgi:hypothetical protein